MFYIRFGTAMTKLFAYQSESANLRPPYIRPAVKPMLKNRQPRPAVETPQPFRSNELTLEQFSRRYHDLPALTAVLGVCDDSLPVLFDLTDARTGPLVALGNPRSGKTSLLKVILQTARQFQGLQPVSHLVIANRPEEYAEFDVSDEERETCRGIFTPDTRDSLDALNQIVKLIDQRSQRGTAGPPILVVFDDLTFLPGAPFEM
jgi:hypothetical protein